MHSFGWAQYSCRPVLADDQPLVSPWGSPKRGAHHKSLSTGSHRNQQWVSRKASHHADAPKGHCKGLTKGQGSGLHWKGRDLRGGPRSGQAGGWRRLPKPLGAVTVGYTCHGAWYSRRAALRAVHMGTDLRATCPCEGVVW